MGKVRMGMVVAGFDYQFGWFYWLLRMILGDMVGIYYLANWLAK